MTRSVVLLFFVSLLYGCESNTTVEEQKMTVSPLELVFQSGESTKTLSVTHNCSCPFNWNGAPLDSTGTLQAFSGNGDNTAKEVTILREQMVSDTLNAAWVVTSNGYGTDTVRVTVIR